MTGPGTALAVDVKDLTIRFGSFTAVDHISFSVGRGEIFGFLGANGAGKTTTIRMLCGLLTPSEGEVRVAGLDLKQGLTPVKERVGYMSQRFTLYQDMTVGENLEFAAALRRMPPERLRLRLKALSEFIGLPDPQRLVQDLPGGLRQEVSLACAMLHDPEIVFLDEPTAGVTPVARERFWTLIRTLAGQGKTVFVTTHYMDEAEHCGRIALMREGKIIALDSPAGLKQTAFPEPMVELTPLTGVDPFRLEQESALGHLRPHGMRIHGLVLDAAAWAQASIRLSREFRIRTIDPSLEDVFIRLVEGEAP